MHSCTGMVRMHRDAGSDFLIVTLLFAYVDVCGIVGLQVAHDRPYT
jgi:hypothetical protein